MILTKENGVVTSSESLKEALTALGDWVYTIEIKKVRQKRSALQNRYFHGVVIPMIAEYSGYITPDLDKHHKALGLSEAKEAIIARYLPETRTRNKLDRRRFVRKQKRTSDCDPADFKNLIDAILLDFPFIPHPNNEADLQSLILSYS